MSIEVERTFRPDPVTPAAVRSLVSEMLRLWECGDYEETASLLASELVTNALIHAGTDITVRLSLDREILLVEVEDGSLELPKPIPLTTDSERGRGLVLMQALSQKWGATRRTDGKVVWFELAVRPRPSRFTPPGDPSRHAAAV